MPTSLFKGILGVFDVSAEGAGRLREGALEASKAPLNNQHGHLRSMCLIHISKITLSLSKMPLNDLRAPSETLKRQIVR